MKVSRQATPAHLIVGIILVVLSLTALIVTFFSEGLLFPFLTFFFGIWGGVELGRYLEHWLAHKNQAA